MMSRALGILVVVALTGAVAACNAISGLDGFEFASGSSSGAGGAGGAGGSSSGAGGAGGAGGAVATCGDGAVEAPEACDDANTTPGDGCDACEVEPGHTCSEAPSVCTPSEPQIVTAGPGLDVVIVDQTDAYDGSLGSMQCVPLHVSDAGFDEVQRVEVTAGIDHPWLGDLVIKVVSPQGTVLTLLNRPGFDEPADDFYDGGGAVSADLSSDHPVTFRDDAPVTAEEMGGSLAEEGVACRDDGVCAYTPAPGSGPGNSLADFSGENPAGTWQLCVADADESDEGRLDLAQIWILSW